MQIKDVERLTKLTQKAIRLYESKGLISAERSENGYREYSVETVERLHTVRLLRGAGVSIPDIRLWCDGVLSLRELLNKRKHEIRGESAEIRTRYELCERMLAAYDGAAVTVDDMLDEGESGAGEPVCGDMLALGLDIGTTTISATVIDLLGGRQIETYNFLNESVIHTDEPYKREQDPAWILDKSLRLLDSVISRYPTVKCIGITGQQHGILYIDKEGKAVSPLYTWQDGRAGQPNGSGKTFVEEIKDLTGHTIATGYGFATHYAMQKIGGVPSGAVSFCSIMDYIAMVLTGRSKPLVHPSVAASFGLYLVADNRFDAEAVEKVNPCGLEIPSLAEGEGVLGYHCGIPVAYPIGDNQADVFGSLRNECESILVNYGTGSQINAVTDTPRVPPTLELRPYMFGRYIQNGSALCGGRAYAMLERFFRSYLEACGISCGTQYEVMNRIASLAGEDALGLAVDTRFSGSRREPDVRGSISGIDESNFTPRHLIVGVLQGMADELYRMFEDCLPQHNGIMVASGNAVRKNPTFRGILEKTFGRSLYMLRADEEAAFGAALYAAVASETVDLKTAKDCINYSES